MKIYKLTSLNEELKNAPSLYFQEQRTAEAVVNTFNEIARKGKKIFWKCEIIEVMSHDEAFEQMLEQGKLFFTK